MSLHSWLRNLRIALAPRRGQRHRGGEASQRAARHRPKLEVLEDRSVPAFLAPVDYAAGPYPYAVVTADLNCDGRLDLATANIGNNGVSILLGNGDGTFQAARNYATGGYFNSIAVGDFNGDGKLDLVTGYPDDYEEDNAIEFLLGNGDGSFQWVQGSSLGGIEPLDLAVADFDADGKLDVAVSSCTDRFDRAEIVVMLGSGNGSFAASSYYPTGLALSLVTADFNRDGKADLAWSDDYLSVAVMLNNGDGTFQAPRNYAAGGTSVAVADLNGDGNPDLLTSDAAVLLGNGDGTFQAAQIYDGGGVVGDFNGDGSLDLLAGDSNLLAGNGNDAGTFPGAACDNETVGDFNGDGRWDRAGTNWVNTVSVALNDGIWDGPPPLLPPSPPSLRINDVTVVEGNTGTVAATFTVTLSAVSNETVTVAYATGDGTATAGSDYQAASGFLTFAPGETSKTIMVLVKGDRLAEPNETFFVNLSNPTNATIADGQGQGTILDDEPRLSIGDVTKSEGKKGQTTQFTFTVTLSAAYDQAVTVSFRTVDGTAKSSEDYIAKTGTLTFAPGETTKTITIEVNGDSKKEADETFYLDLFGNSSNSLFTKNRGIGTILNDD